MLNQSASKIVLVLPSVAKKYCDRFSGIKKNKFIPHITLGMGVLDYANLHRVKKILKIVAYKFSSLDLTITERDSDDIYGLGKELTYFKLEETKKLWELHQTVMMEFAKYMSEDEPKEANFFSEEPVTKGTITMVENYPREHAFRQWKPMIELGYADLNTQTRDFNFYANRLAVWKIGNDGALTREMFYTALRSKR